MFIRNSIIALWLLVCSQSFAGNLVNPYILGVATPPTNLITNGDMELSSDWTTYNSTQLYNTSIYHGGIQALQVTDNGSVATSFQQVTGLTVSASYTISGWCRSSSSNTGSEYARIAFSSSETNNSANYLTTNTGATDGATPNNTWQYIEETFTATDTSGFLILVPQINTGDISYFDDITMVEN